MSVRTPHRVRRLEDGRLEHYFPDANAEGFYVLGDPALGHEQHHKKNAIYAGSVHTALHLVRTYGFAIRMRGNVTGQWNLIRRDEVQDL